ncbi:antirestriction protein [Cellvibrio sp. UBA7671]|uniref:antirestriction protein n=1 Tax=Cellvibrio sp. UBA7671 TaxID=1946312 RepID=UPI002F358E16
MSTATASQSKIVATVVPGHLRAATLPKRFPGMFLVFESLVYRYLEVFSDNYKGGYWEFFDLSNGGFYMSLNSNARFYLSIASNGFEGEMTADAASLVVNMFAIGQLANQHKTDYLIELYHLLRTFVSEHPEVNRILCAID